jgi:hypothetical protein
LHPHPTTTPSKQEDEYEDDEYEEVFADEGVAAAAGVEPIDDDDDGEGDDEDEDDYDDEDEDAGAASSQAEEEQQGGRALVAATGAGTAAAGGGRRRGQRGDGGSLAAAVAGKAKRAAQAVRPASLLRTAGDQFRRVTRQAWRIEGAATFTAKLAVRLAKRAARPVLIAVVAHRTLGALSASRAPHNMAMRLPASKQQDYLFERALGRDWREVMRKDLLEACAEVDEGLNTEEVNEEKRAYQAAVLRRLEVEEWDKERMRHYYYGLYGLGPWYWDMEERLHNPFFVASRGWNSPIEAWVGKNKAYRRDVVASQRTGDGVSDALRALGEARGAPVPDHVGRSIKQRETLSAADALLTDKAMVEALTSGMKGPGGAPLSDAERKLVARDELERARERRRREREAEEARFAA